MKNKKKKAEDRIFRFWEHTPAFDKFLSQFSVKKEEENKEFEWNLVGYNKKVKW